MLLPLFVVVLVRSRATKIVKKALSHKEGDATWAAYERGDHWPKRVEIAQWWSDHRDQLRKGADIVQFPEWEAV